MTKYIFQDEANILLRLADENSQKVLQEFAQEFHERVEEEEQRMYKSRRKMDLEDILSPLLEKLLVKYLFYSILGVPADSIPRKLLHRTYFDDLKYVFYYFGPRLLSLMSSFYNNPKVMRDNPKEDSIHW